MEHLFYSSATNRRSMEASRLSNTQRVFLTICLLLIFGHPAHPYPAPQDVHRRTLLPGGLSDVPNFRTDPEVQHAAEFAVEEYTRQQNLAQALELWKVVSAKYQVVEGMMYYLTLLAGSGGKSHRYEAKVWVKPRQEDNMSLQGFKRVSS